MNDKQKTVAIIVSIILGLMLLFPPFHVKNVNQEIHQGYHLIFSRPSGPHIRGNTTINVSLLVIQYLVTITIGAILYFAFNENNIIGKKESAESKNLSEKKKHSSSLKVDDGKSEWICSCGTHNPIDLGNCSNCRINKFNVV
ncbi:hypothetical protein ACFL36_05330 [Thermodesulfobacteriota bacterium]